jgi:hypothetical protein
MGMFNSLPFPSSRGGLSPGERRTVKTEINKIRRASIKYMNKNGCKNKMCNLIIKHPEQYENLKE